MSSALPILPSWNPRAATSAESLSESHLIEIINACVPAHTFRSQRKWVWTRPSGVWHLQLTLHERDEHATLKALLDGLPGSPSVTVRTTRREVNAAIRWLVLLDAIDRHPDDPQAAAADR